MTSAATRQEHGAGKETKDMPKDDGWPREKKARNGTKWKGVCGRGGEEGLVLALKTFSPTQTLWDDQL